jgi:hypothetical protein
VPGRDWKDRAQGYETPSERFCRHNGIPYRGGCGSLQGTRSAARAARDARAQAMVTLMLRKKTDGKLHDPEEAGT